MTATPEQLRDISPVPRSAISLGAAVRALLMDAPGVAGTVTAVYPVIEAEADCPYIVYRCSSVTPASDKETQHPDNATIEICVYDKDYDQGVDIAEAVRDALDGAHYEDYIYGSRCINYSNGWAADAYYHLLTFNIRTNPL